MFVNLPNMGIRKKIRLKLIRKALKSPHAGHVPDWVTCAVTQCRLHPTVDAEDVNEEKNAIPLLNEALPLPKLPRTLELLCSKWPKGFHPAMVIASLPILGTLATGVRLRYYDNSTHSLSFFSCVVAPQASGKSFIRKPTEILLRRITEQDAIEREKEREYKRTAKAMEKQGVIVEENRACIRNVGVNISMPRLLQLLDHSGSKHLIGVGAEIDSLQRSDRGSVRSQRQDVFRLAFDNDAFSQENMGTNSYSGNIPVYYNLLVTGTQYATHRFFNDLEGGLISRICFAQLPDSMGEDIPRFETFTQAEESELIRTSEWLMRRDDRLECPIIMDVIHAWTQKMGDMAIACDSRAANILSKRSGVIGFRAGCLAYLLGQLDSDTPYRKKEAAEFALWVAKYVFKNQMELFGNALEAIMQKIDKDRHVGRIENLLLQLPHVFTKQDLLTLRLKNHQSQNISLLLTRWKRKGWIVQTESGAFRKTA